MLISELARETGLSTDTIRYYEKAHLLDDEHITRKQNNYRQYSRSAINRLLLIKRAQMIGFTLAEISRLIRAWETDQLTMAEKEQLFHEKIAQINAKIAELEDMKRYLHLKMEELQAGELMANTAEK